MLKGKNIVLGVSGGIAAYKSLELVSRLKKRGANVDVIMTANAARFVAPLSFETLSKNRVVTDTFDRNFKYEVEHVSLAKKADLFVIAPMTANLCGKLAGSICDDMLTTTVAATRAPVLLCPAMNTGMYENPIFQEKLAYLKAHGYLVLEPNEGLLACGDVGKGRMAEPCEIEQKILELLTREKDFAGKRVLVTAGATVEDIDGVRFISNYSSGKMGTALCRRFAARGAEVTLVAGRMSVPEPDCRVVRVKSTEQMYEAVLREMEQADIIVKAAAPADYRVEKHYDQKLKSDGLTLKLVKNPDIAKAVGERKGDRKLIVFCAETENLIENAEKKLISKNADLIVANDVTKEGAGFNADTNVVTVIDRQGLREESGKRSKDEIADFILDRISRIL